MAKQEKKAEVKKAPAKPKFYKVGPNSKIFSAEEAIYKGYQLEDLIEVDGQV